MHALKKKLCSRAYGGIQGSLTRRRIAQREISGFPGARVVKEMIQSAHAVEESGVSGAKLEYIGASSWIRGSDSRLRKANMETLVRLEGLQIGGFRQMGITTRPGDRAAEHGVRNPLPKADGSPQRIEEERQDEFLRVSKKAAASKVEQVEEAVGGEGGASFEAADAETKAKLGMGSADAVQETASEFTKRSESQSTSSHPAVDATSSDVEVDDDAKLQHGIDEDVQRGLMADSEHPAGRVVKEDDQQFSQPEGQSEEGVMTGVLGDWAVSKKEAEKDRTDKVHPYSADKLYSTDEALDEGQIQWEKGTSVESGAPKLVAEDHEKSEGGYGSFKSHL